jgi:hypothetical protein
MDCKHDAQSNANNEAIENECKTAPFLLYLTSLHIHTHTIAVRFVKYANSFSFEIIVDSKITS